MTRFIGGSARAMGENREVSNSPSPSWNRISQPARFSVICIALGGLLFVGGCGGAYSSTAYGVVTLDGNVVPRGAVTFQPLRGGAAAYGMIGGDGKYAVRTGRESGLTSGEYEVIVTANERHRSKQTGTVRRRRAKPLRRPGIG